MSLAPIQGKVVLLRADLNVQMVDGVVTDTFRIDQIIPTIKSLISRGAKVVVISHLGRPNGRDESLTLKPIAPLLSERLGTSVPFVNDCIGPVVDAEILKLNPGNVILLENLRFYAGEEANDPEFAKQLALNCDIFVNDAFATAHRAHASTYGVTQILPSYAGLLMHAEVNALSSIFDNPKKPVLAIIAGSKVSTKIDVLKNLIKSVNSMIIDGAMGTTFCYAMGYAVGDSLYEPTMKETALEIMELAKQYGCELILPVDKTIAKKYAPESDPIFRDMNKIEPDDVILDAGPISTERQLAAIDKSKMVIWNGTVGMAEWANFSRGSFAIANHLAEQTKMGKIESICGGGDTVAAINATNTMNDMTYVSTAGGAFLEFVEGKKLPGVEALREVE